MVEQAFTWLTDLPPLALYLALAAAAAIENVFPPLPADTIVAFGAFLAARGEATPTGTFLATWVGNLAGAMAVYAVARRFGAEWLEHRLKRFGGVAREEKLLDMYEKRGLIALFVSRFIPGIRALVPPLAGALRVPAPRMALAMAIASAIWYGTVTWVAYRVGADWEALQARVGQLSRGTAIVAAAVIAIAIGAWFVSYRRRNVVPP